VGARAFFGAQRVELQAETQKVGGDRKTPTPIPFNLNDLKQRFGKINKTIQKVHPPPTPCERGGGVGAWGGGMDFSNCFFNRSLNHLN
jgi:hypothetical protein